VRLASDTISDRRLAGAGRLRPIVRALAYSLSFSVLLAPSLSAGSLFGRGAASAALAGRRAVLVSPEKPQPGRPLRVLTAFENDAADVRVVLRGATGDAKPLALKRGGGPPFWVAAEFAAAPAGTFQVILVEGRDEIAAGASSGLLDVSRGWSWASEALYAAWIEALFADADERSSWPALHDVTRDRGRNLLHDHLGFGEDDPSGPNSLEMTPDCADNPFFLRAYFAWKLGLPFGFRETGWGTLESAPKAGRLIMFETRRPGSPGNTVPAMRRFLNQAKNVIHAGNGRTALRADDTDYYPLPLTRRALKPGTVFADPYGHTYTLVRWIGQTRKTPGLLLGADAQPDGTVAVKRFWKGNFLFTTSEVVGEPGFKAFRPIVIDGGRPRQLTNREIAASPDYGDFSLEQEKMSPDAFYAAMEKLINPDPLDAKAAFEDLFRALHEQLIVRVDSVAKGEAYATAHPGAVIAMPSGPSVFQSLGSWEDYSTPNRDLRLLIAIDTISEFPDKVARDPAAYDMGRKAPDEIRRELRALADKWAASMTITYKGSDGSSRTLSLADIFRRKDAFEMGYNPNDSIEIRWGAPAGSAELATVRRRAPASQLAKMRALQPWFHKRLRPAV
jgi:hypothetical protein